MKAMMGEGMQRCCGFASFIPSQIIAMVIVLN